MSAAHKRQRTPSQSSSVSSNTEHSSKVSRVTPEVENGSSHGASHPLLCSLPPTCNQRPTPIANTKDLEAHYAKFHAHVCEEKRCGCVFPDARLLELHQTECHDSLAAVRKERGEKIFACHLPTCPRLFMTPKARRLHLIQAHGYPKEYFFAVTNKGVGGLLKRWGEGASMIRKEWKPREEKGKGKEVDVNKMDIRGDEENDENSNEAEEQPTPRVQPRLHPGNLDDGVDALAGSMSSLALVPPSIRFGRGGVKGGFGHHPEPHTSHARGRVEAVGGHITRLRQIT
ncbi:hypothetical protein BDQ17DRAFT_1313735 [Cyathus striatus]|nr:hypothetical protein BDQ17DRAFT_1313735 [Cyathus striatus]